MQRIIVVRGGKELAFALRCLLESGDFDVSCVNDVSVAAEAIMQHKPALVIMDAERYDKDFEKLLWYISNLREAYTVRRVLLAEQASVEDMVRALEQGADNVLLRSISPRELRAQIEAVLRLCPVASQDKILAVGNLRLREVGLEVEVDNETKKLTRTEFNLLAFFMKQPDQVISREDLLKNLWFDYEDLEYMRTVDIYVCRLRGKIEADPAHPTRLLTRRGQGYTLVSECPT